MAKNKKMNNYLMRKDLSAIINSLFIIFHEKIVDRDLDRDLSPEKFELFVKHIISAMKVCKKAKKILENEANLNEESIYKYGTKDEITFLKEYQGEDIGIPHPPVGDKKYCEKCGEGMGKMSNKEWEKKGRICDACAREEHLDKETR